MNAPKAYLFFLVVNGDKWVILGDENLTSRTEKILQEKYSYTKEDISDMRLDLGVQFGGNPEIGWIVGDKEVYETPKGDLIFIQTCSPNKITFP